MDQDETWHGGRPRLWPHCVTWGPSSIPKAAQTPIFGPCLLWPIGEWKQHSTYVECQKALADIRKHGGGMVIGFLRNGVVKEGCIPEDWKSSVLLPIYKGKSDPMECGSYRAIQLWEHATKVVERIFGT